jgi:hypothetical protein
MPCPSQKHIATFEISATLKLITIKIFDLARNSIRFNSISKTLPKNHVTFLKTVCMKPLLRLSDTQLKYTRIILREFFKSDECRNKHADL